MDYLKTLSFIGVMSGLVAYIVPRCSENTTKLKKKMNKNKIPHSPYSAVGWEKGGEWVGWKSGERRVVGQEEAGERIS